jgi:hypothetical protein
MFGARPFARFAPHNQLFCDFGHLAIGDALACFQSRRPLNRESVVKGFFGLLVAAVLAASAATLIIPHPSMANPILYSGVSY